MNLINIDNDYPATLKQRLRHQRLRVGWTQSCLARHSGTSQAVIQKIENGKSLRPRKIDAIAEALKVSPAWLMYGGIRQKPSDVLKPIATLWPQLSIDEQQYIKLQIQKLLAQHQM